MVKELCGVLEYSLGYVAVDMPVSCPQLAALTGV